MSPTTRPRTLSTAEDRREDVLSTAIGAFAARGYFGTTTVEVAKRAGISQAYLYRLFPDKESLFAAVVERCFERFRESLSEGAATAEGSSPEAVLSAMAGAYVLLIRDQELLLVQLHAQCAAVSVPEIRQAVQRGYARLVEYARSVSGGSQAQVQELFARGALCNAVVTMGAEQVDAPWARTLSAGLRP
ncbi:Biofilm operon icaADBC HTH-type negative transcriptional regulator IcaR [Micromonospora sp. MW-13]|uniref:TetR/AcrR family transcriptional regulator n=1 Tax=Micromonospora sp. MW-13 TaxID=2094022 RepID=UPI000E451401|nr:TetR/AcrR family transcriptional regulator [Micromonospora sp. MW-13]RGC65783.1 Biofilm operon icaADBC HTH-type negative transcriptional regulator IcaR [Micromonospora sp. MW-13]